MQFQVPQNITMEDKIIGPLTAIQFGIVIVGGGIAFIVFTSTALPSPFNTIGGLFFALLTVVMAIGKFNDQPMYRFFRFIIAFILAPKTRVWRKVGAESRLVKETQVEDSKRRTSSKRVTRQDLANLSKIIDSRGQAGSLPISAMPVSKERK